MGFIKIIRNRNLKGIMECKCIFFDCIKMDNDDVKKKVLDKMDLIS